MVNGEGIDKVANDNSDLGGKHFEDADFESLLSVKLKKIGDLISEIAPKMVSDVKGVRFTEVRILAYLMKRSSASILEIGQDLLVDKAWVSRLVRFLDERGFIAREKQRDGHTVLVRVTEAGREAYTIIMADLLRHQPTFLRGVDQEAAEVLCERLEANLHQLREGLGVPAAKAPK